MTVIALPPRYRRACALLLATTLALAAAPAASALAISPVGSTQSVAGSANPFPKPTVAHKGFQARPGIPAITANATNLGKAPRIAKGTGKPRNKLVVRDVILGGGNAAQAQDTVTVRYVGVLYKNGKVFDSSWRSGTASVSFPLGELVTGFAAGVVGMRVGGRREIVIPPSLGYGSSRTGPIPPNSTLVFVVDLVSVRTPQSDTRSG